MSVVEIYTLFRKCFPYVVRDFEKRGYVHDWGNESNCFDMKFPLCEFTKDGYNVGDAIEGICYRFASIEDRNSVSACTDAACKEFTRWYQDEFLYTENKTSRVLIAEADGRVVGTLMVDTDYKSGLGSVGCTAMPAIKFLCIS